MPVFEARNIPADPPKPPPEPVHSAKPEPQPNLPREREVADEVLSLNDNVVIPMPPAPPIPDEVIRLPPAPPAPEPSVKPRLAKPSNSPADWVTTSDYPAHELREGNQGLARFLLTIGANGKVDACTITQSTGFRALDEATCRNVSRRARFKPATDSSGAKITGSYSGSVRWVIPER